MNFDLYSRTRNEVVLKDVFVASTFVKRFTGLMFRKDAAPYSGLVFYRTGGIHTCFMRFALDIIFIDCNMKVIKIFKGVGPFRMVLCLNAYAAIEFPSGTSGTVNEGDILEFKHG